MKKEIEKESVDFWHREMNESQNFAVFDLEFWNDRKAKNIFMDVFIVL